MLERFNISKTTFRAIIGICLISCIVFASAITSTVLAYIMQSYPDSSEQTVMSIVTIPSLVSMFLAFGVAPLTKRFNIKALVIVSFLPMVIYFLILWLGGGTASIGVLLFAAALLGIKNGMSVPLIQVMISEYIDVAKRATIIAISSSLISALPAILYPICGMVAAGNGGADWPLQYLVALVFTVPFIIAFLFIMPSKPDPEVTAANNSNSTPEEKTEATEKKSTGKFSYRAIMLIVANALANLAFMTYALYLSSYVITEYQLGTSVEVGWVNSLNMIVGLIIGFLYVFIEKALKRKVGPVGMIMILIGLVSMAYITTSIVGVALTAFLIGVGYGIAYPAIVAEIMKILPSSKIPFAMALIQVTTSVTTYLTPYVLNYGSIVFGGSLHAKVLVGVIISGVCVVITVLMFRSVKVDETSKALSEQNL